MVVLSTTPLPPTYKAPGIVHLLEILQSLWVIVSVELLITLNSPFTWTPFAPLPSAVTVELLIVKFPADNPWALLLLKLTKELINSKCDPFEPLPVLLTTSIFEFSALTTKVPVNPERLWSDM